MSVVTAFTVPGTDFLMGSTLEEVPDAHVEIERVAVEEENVTPYVWAGGDDFEAFEDALADDPTVAEYLALEAHGTYRLYRIGWERNAEGIVYAVSEANATILRAESDGTDWQIELLFPDEGLVSTFRDYAAANDLSFDLQWLQHSTHSEALGKYGVTDEQREALVTAYERGYFEVPGEISLSDLAGELDISKNAASARLHRGYANLVENTLVHDE